MEDFLGVGLEAGAQLRETDNWLKMPVVLAAVLSFATGKSSILSSNYFVSTTYRITHFYLLSLDGVLYILNLLFHSFSVRALRLYLGV